MSSRISPPHMCDTHVVSPSTLWRGGTHECIVSWPYVSHFFPMCRWPCVDPIWGVCQCWYTLRSKWQVEVSIRSSAYGQIHTWCTEATVHSRSPSPWVIIYRLSYLPVVDPEETAESDSGMTIGENARKKRCGIDSPPAAFWITLGSGKRHISQRRFRNGPISVYEMAHGLELELPHYQLNLATAGAETASNPRGLDRPMLFPRRISPICTRSATLSILISPANDGLIKIDIHQRRLYWI